MTDICFSRLRLRRGAMALAFVLAALPLHAQRIPHIGYVYPAGGQQGTSFEVRIGGQYLDGVDSAWISAEGVQAKILDHVKPTPQKEINKTRDKLREVQKKIRRLRREKLWPKVNQEAALMIIAKEHELTEEHLFRYAAYRSERADPRRQPNAQIGETVRVKVTIPKDAAPGFHSLRLNTRGGLTNPMTFRIGQVRESREAGNRSDYSWEYLASMRGYNQEVSEPPRLIPTVPLPSIRNGQILPGEVDEFRFRAEKGRKVVVAVEARTLIPYLADAVPGWFQAAVSLHDQNGNEVAFADDYLFDPDPVLCFDIPKSGVYSIRIRDAIYRGREDFVYRVKVGELPFVTSVYPLGGPVGKASEIEVKGWNLPEQARRMTVTPDSTGIRVIHASKSGILSNPVSFHADVLPEVAEQEENDSRDRAQPVSLPLIVNGRIEKPGDVDCFRFEGEAGERMVIEVNARRLNSPVDSFIQLLDAAGTQVAFNDDHTDRGSGLTTHHADSYLECDLPAAGNYFIRVSDTQNQGGPAHAYRLRVSRSQPGFDLRLTPCSVSARPGETTPLTVHALRRDGFAGDIQFRLKESPAGFAVNGWVPSGSDKARITLTVPAQARAVPVGLKLEGSGKDAGREITGEVVPVEDMMQAFFYHHYVPAESLLVQVKGGASRLSGVSLSGAIPASLPVGGETVLHLHSEGRVDLTRITVKLEPAIRGLKIRYRPVDKSLAEIILGSDATQVIPGLRDNLILTAISVPKGGQGKWSKLGFLPAIPFELTGQFP